MLAALDAQVREHARERQDPGGLRQRGGRAAPARRGSTTGSRPARSTSACSRRRCRRSCSQLGERLRASANLRFVDARLELILERDHQLDALERAQAQLLERRRAARRRGRARTSRAAPRPDRLPCAAHRLRARSPPSRGSPRASASRAFGARQLAVRPDRDAANALMILQLQRSPSRTTASASAPGSSTSTACTRLLSRLPRPLPDDRGLDARPAARSARARRLRERH